MTKKVGVFIHCRNLSSQRWEELVWGVPSQDKLGDVPTAIAVLLSQKLLNSRPLIVIGQGPSQKDGMLEGSYTKYFALKHLDSLRHFDRLKLDEQQPDVMDRIRGAIKSMQVSAPIKNTKDETTRVAELFTQSGVEIVYEIAAATHASRCIKEQTVARAAGHIPSWQRWFVTPTDISYAHTSPADVVVIEPLHRLDQGSLKTGTELARHMNAYYTLHGEEQREFVDLVAQYFQARNSRP